MSTNKAHLRSELRSKREDVIGTLKVVLLRCPIVKPSAACAQWKFISSRTLKSSMNGSRYENVKDHDLIKAIEKLAVGVRYWK
jgi:hypothetical protein